jgi:hypothetical protein
VEYRKAVAIADWEITEMEQTGAPIVENRKAVAIAG